MVKVFLIDSMLHTSRKNLLVKQPPLPHIRSVGGSYLKTHSFTKHLATYAVEMPFIGMVLVNFVNLSVMTNRYSLRHGVLMNSPKISMHTDVRGSVVGNTWSCYTFLRN